MLKIHEALQAGRAASLPRLAEDLEVSSKTVQRDVEFMRERLRLPVQFSRTHGGYRYTEPVAGFPSVHVTEGEVVALLVAQRALEQYRGTPFEETLRSAFAKLTNAMQDETVFTPGPGVSFRPLGVSTHDLGIFELLHTCIEVLEAAFDGRAIAFLKANVAYRQAFVDEIHIEVDRQAQSQRKAGAHAGGIGPHRHVKIPAKFGEILHESENSAAVRPIDTTDKTKIFLAGEGSVEAPETHWPRNAAVSINAAVGGLLGASEDSQER
jgi:biotin operon repressor